MSNLSKSDLEKLEALGKKMDLGQLIGAVSSLDDASLKGMLKMLSKGGSSSKKPLPAVDGDFFDIDSTLTPAQKKIKAEVRTFMEKEVEPIINEYWSKDEFPKQLIPKFQELKLIEKLFNQDGSRTEDASIVEGVTTMELARIDVSTATFFGVHAGLALTSIALGGSAEQKAKWLPKMIDMSIIGAFGLTEPEVGSGVAGGLRTTCKKDGDSWVLNGEKYWIGNSTFADIIVIWARDLDDGEVKGFIVEADNPGFNVEKIMGKIALRSVENGHIKLTDCRIKEADRLQEATSFRKTAEVLKLTRAGVAWQGVGAAMGAYEKALAYSQNRKQFGKRIGNFQLIQNHLVLMLGDLTAMQQLCMRLSVMQARGEMRDEHASLAKVFTAARCREVVARAREVFGGKGILLDEHIARMFCDVEAIYSYEGTNEINTLVVGRAITGMSSFV